MKSNRQDHQSALPIIEHAFFDAAPRELQKLTLQKCLASIVVDPNEEIVHAYVRKIPAISAGIEKAFNSLESKALLDITACARNGP